jgi:hypothetical protein
MEPDGDEGPVLITVTFTVPPERARLLTAMQRVRVPAGEPALRAGNATGMQPFPVASWRRS